MSPYIDRFPISGVIMFSNLLYLPDVNVLFVKISKIQDFFKIINPEI